MGKWCCWRTSSERTNALPYWLVCELSALRIAARSMRRRSADAADEPLHALCSAERASGNCI
eukprot:scaffold95887_cov31-Tisochrysis_lutea.AAC.3